MVFWEQCADPFEDKKDCVDALLEIDPVEEFDQGWEEGVDEMSKVEGESSGVEPELEERKDQGRIKADLTSRWRSTDPEM